MDCHLLSGALGDGLFGRLARARRILLRGGVRYSSRRYFNGFLHRISLQYMRSTDHPPLRSIQTVG